MQAAEFFVDALAVYGLTGAVFAVAFVLFGIHHIDPVAEQAFAHRFSADRHTRSGGALAAPPHPMVEGSFKESLI